MKDFIYAALPWIIIGLTIAVLAVNVDTRERLAFEVREILQKIKIM